MSIDDRFGSINPESAGIVPGLSTDSADMAAPTSLYARFSTGSLTPDASGFDSAGDLRVNYADPADPNVRNIGRTSDPFQLDTDPFGTRTQDYGRRVNLQADFNSDTAAELSVFGKKMSAEYLRTSEAGRELLNLAERNRRGMKRDFVDALTDFKWSDLPFVSLFATVGGSVKDAVTVSSTLKKLQNGDAVTDDELIKTRLYIEEQRYRENGTWGSTVGDIIRAAPGFMAEFFVSGGLFSAARSAAAKSAETAIHIGMSRASKILAREATEQFAKEATKKTVGKLGSAAFAELAENGSRKQIVDKVATQVLNATMKDNPVYRGMSDAALRSMATSRAEYEFTKMLARNSGGAMRNNFNRFTQWMGQNVSRGLMDFGQWGTEESTVLFTSRSTAGRALADAVGTFFVEAPLKGTALMLPNQLIAKPAVSAVAGVDKPVSDAQLSLQTSALMTDNKSLMDNAESIAFGMNLLEYVSENTGRGLKSLMRGAGLALEKAGVKGLVSKTDLAFDAAGGIVPTSPDAARSFGGKIREFVEKAFGSRESFLQKSRAEKLDIAASALGIGKGADRAALESAIMSGSTANLRRDIADRIGPSVEAFVDKAVRDAYDSGVKTLQYKSYARFAVANWMAKHNVGPETVMNLYEQMGYDGILGEMFEERYSDVVKGMLGLDDRAEHDFFSNLKEAVKGIYPGWDQLTAEAVGFAMPMVSRAAVLRLQSAVGGGGRLAEIRTRLEGITDALRHDTAMSMKYGTYLKLHDTLSANDAARRETLAGQLEKAELANDTASAESITREIERLDKIAERRQERHDKFLGTLDEAAKANADEIVTVPLVDDETLANDELYHRAPLINSDQAAETLAGQSAAIDYAPELAKILYLAEAPLEGETTKWYRRAAHKIVGLAGAAVTGDMSLAATNPEQWVARDMGLPANVCRALKEGFRREYATQAEYLRSTHTDAAQLDANRASAVRLLELARSGLMSDGETKFTRVAQQDRILELTSRIEAIDRARADVEKGVVPTYMASAEEVADATAKAFAAKAKQIMGSYLAVNQLRSFSDGQIRDQALAHVAKTLGYEHAVVDGEVQFVKIGREGVEAGTEMSADEFYAAHSAEVDDTHEKLTVATADLMTRHLTKSHDADVRLMNAIRYSADSDLIDTAIYDTALNLIGSEGLVHSQRIDGKVPLSEALYSNSVAKVSSDVMAYIAGFDDASQVEDRRSLEAAAFSMGLRFDGTERGLRERDDRIFRMAKLASFLDAGKDSVYYTKPTAIDESDERLHSTGTLQLRADLQADGSYAVEIGKREDGKPNVLKAKNRRELDGMMRTRGFSRTSARILFTQAKVIECSDMFHMIRDLGLGDEYLAAFGTNPKASRLHPMLRKENGRYMDEEKAQDQLRKELAAAADWNPDTQSLRAGAATALKPAVVRAYWENAWGENGYMTVGERILERRGVTKNTISKYAGEFSEYSPVLYTLGVNAYRYSRNSADVLVPIDPLVNDDLTSGVLNAVLLQAFAKPSSQRLLRTHLNSTISYFVRDVDAAIEIAKEKAVAERDDELVRGLNAVRDTLVSDVDEEVEANGEIIYRRGTGFRAEAFVQFASAFCAYRAENYRANPHLRALAAIAPMVRNSPTFLDFMGIVDLCLGGSGFLGEATRNASGGAEIAANQRGIQQLVSYATGDSAAFKKAVRESLPGGMSYTAFLEGCIAHMNSLARSGVPTVPQKRIDELTEMAKAADAADDDSVAFRHFTFVGQLCGVIKGILNPKSGKAPKVTKTVADFFSDVVRQALATDTNSTSNQRRMLEATEKLLQKSASADRAAAEHVELVAENASLKSQLERLRKRKVDISRELIELHKLSDDLKRTGKQKTLSSKLADVLAEIDRKNGELAENQRKIVRATAKAGVTLKTAMRRKSALDGAGEAKPMADHGVAGESDLTISMSDDMMAIPEVFSNTLKNTARRYAAKYGYEKLETEATLTRSQSRLAVNVAVRTTLSLDGSVDEDSVVAAAHRLFPALSEGEVEDIRIAYRTADNLRLRHGLTWDKAAQNGSKWTFVQEEREEDDVSSDDLGDKALSEYNSQAVADFLALAERCSPESGKNLQGFLKLSRETSRRASMMKDTYDGYTQEAVDAVDFLHNLLNPKMNPDGKTQAEHDALHHRLLMEFGSRREGISGERVSGYVRELLSAGADGHPVSRRGAFLLSYLASLPENARIRFGKIVAHSVAATPVRRNSEGAMENAHRSSHGRVSENIVGDSFIALVGKDRAELPEIATRLREYAAMLKGSMYSADADDAEAERILKEAGIDYDETNLRARYATAVLEHNSDAVAAVFAKEFGTESPIFSALTSDMAKGYRRGENHSTVAELAKSVSFRENQKGAGETVDVVETVAATIEALASFGEGAVTRGEVSAAFTAAFATGNPTRASLARTTRSAMRSDPLMAFLVTFSDSLPTTIMTAEVDQERDSNGGSSVAVAPRDVAPLIARWLYSDTKTANSHEGDSELSFAEACSKFFGVTDEETIAQCRQDATWPDEQRTPICAKNLSVSYNNRELLEFCDASFRDPATKVYWVPIYAGDHNSSVMLQVPKSVILSTAVAEGERRNSDLVSKYGKDAAYFEKFNDILDALATLRHLGKADVTVADVKNMTGQLGAVNIGYGHEDFVNFIDLVSYLMPDSVVRDGDHVSITGDVDSFVKAAAKNRKAKNGSIAKLADKVESSDEGKVEYKDAAKAVYKTLGVDLMYTDAKRSAISSLETQGCSMIGCEVTEEQGDVEPVADVTLDPDGSLVSGGLSVSAVRFSKVLALNVGEATTLRNRPSADDPRQTYEDGSLIRIDRGFDVPMVFRVSYSETKEGGVKSVTFSRENPPVAETKRNVRFGENRIHIVKSVRSEGSDADELMSEAWKGSTFLYGYAADALKEMAEDPSSSTIKAHVISTYGYDLFFGKSLAVATSDRAGKFLENSSERVAMDYLEKYRGKDRISSDFLTDFDSYKIGPANSKSLRVWNDGPGKKKQGKSLMVYVFEVLEKQAREGKKFSKLTGAELDAAVGKLKVRDFARGGKLETKTLSEILPGVVVNSVDGFAGEGTIDVSYQENGAMAYPVANVSHKSGIPRDPGRTPRNYEIDAFTMATALSANRLSMPSESPAFEEAIRGTYELIANWGLVANSVYSDPNMTEALRRQSEALDELIKYGEDPRGQNALEELARLVWSRTREASNLPISGIDAPLVSAGAAFDEKTGKVYVHTKSKMHEAMMQGSELFTKAESGFFGLRRRVALCNVNCRDRGFRYGWFLNEETFLSSERMAQYVAMADKAMEKDKSLSASDPEARFALALEYCFNDLRAAQARAGAAVTEEDAEAEAKKVSDFRRDIADCFVDHHGRAVSAYDSKYLDRVGFDDLFRRGGTEFDRSAVRFGRDRVFNDATGKSHVFLGGTMFGLPRTPSYNGSMWLQTVRAGLPVTEIEKQGEKPKDTTYEVGRDAMVSPDPVTNALLGCDHDGDKTKLYMLTVDADGVTRESVPPSPRPTGTTKDGKAAFSADDFCTADPATGEDGRAQYLRDIYAEGMLERVRFDPETGEEVPAEANEEGAYYRISDTARRRVSNAFVRNLFDLSLGLPVAEERGTKDGHVHTVERYSKPGEPRLKFFGGVASKGTSAFPVGDKDMKAEVVAHALPETMNAANNLGDPAVAAKVSAAANDVSSSRAQIVSFAMTLHLAWASGYFTGGKRDLFFGNTNAADWFRFMHHVDGLSNATFDDLKEQMCTRLGWTSGMMDTLITQIMFNNGKGRLPTTDAEFRDILIDYVEDIKSKGRFYWMKEVTDPSNPENLKIRTMFCGDERRRVTKRVVANVFGIEGAGTEKDPCRIAPVAEDGQMTRAQIVAAGFARCADKHAKEFGPKAGEFILSAIADGVSQRGGSNPMAGYVYWAVNSIFSPEETESGDFVVDAREGYDGDAEDLIEQLSDDEAAYEFCQWAVRRQMLLGARSFAQSVNYLRVDPGDDNANGKRNRVAEAYRRNAEFLSEHKEIGKNGVVRAGKSDYDLASAFERMHAATRLAYEIGNGLQTVAGRAITAANVYDEQLIPSLAARNSGRADERAFGKLFLRDSVPAYDRLQLQANGQQLPYACALFDTAGVLAEGVGGTTLFSGRDLYDALKYMSGYVGFGLDSRFIDRGSGMKAARRNSEILSGRARTLELASSGEDFEPADCGFANVLAMRHAVESAFEVMYELMSTSVQFNAPDGNKAIAYLRMAKDKAFESKKRTYFDHRAGENVTVRDYPYGIAGDGLYRIMPQFTANNDDSIGRIREMFDGIISGRDFTDARRMVDDRGGLDTCTTFSISRESLEKFVDERIGSKGRKLKTLDAKLRLLYRENDGARLAAMVRDALMAVEGLQAMYDAKGISLSAEITPSMMFGQLLPAYTVLTSRTLGAPGPSSSSLLSILPDRYYRELSKSQRALDELDPEFMSALVATKWGPRNGGSYAVKLAKDGNLAVTNPDDTGYDVGGEIAEAVRVNSPETLPSALAALGEEMRGGPAARELRDNPDFRHSVDIFADDVFSDVVDYIEEGWTSATDEDADATAAGEKASGQAEVKEGVVKPELKYDEGVAKVARMAAHLLGSWCTVEYTGGPTFVIRGKLRGNAANGRQVLLVVGNRDGMVKLDTEDDVRYYANSRAYAESLCTAADLGITASDFMRLEEPVRMALVKRFGVGGASSHDVAFSFSGKGIATLVGAIGVDTGNTSLYHEYFHTMMRVFESIGLFTDKDYEDLRRRFGDGIRSDRMFNEEAAAEAFRKWVQGNSDENAEDTRGVFRKIFDFLKNLFESLVRGFNYRDASDDQLFSMFVHGIAQTSESGANAAIDSTLAKGTMLSDEDKVAYADAVNDGDFVAASAIVGKAFAPIATKESKKLARHGLAKTAQEVSYDLENGLFQNGYDRQAGIESGGIERNKDFEDVEGFKDIVDFDVRKRNKSAAKRLVNALKGSGNAFAVKNALAEYAGIRREMASMIQLPAWGSLDWEDLTVGAEAPGEAEARAAEKQLRAHENAVDDGTRLRKEVRSAVKAGTFRIADRNDFYRAGDAIARSVEESLKTNGSWNDALEQIKRRYAMPNWRHGTNDSADIAAIKNGLRRAMVALNPDGAKAVKDDKLISSLAFRVALQMYASLERSFISQDRVDKNGNIVAPNRVSGGGKATATQYDVAAWILSTRPGAPADMTRRTLNRVRRLLRQAKGKEAKDEIRMHLRMASRILDIVGDTTGLVDFRNGNHHAEFNTIISELAAGTIPGKYDKNGFLGDIRPVKNPAKGASERHYATFSKCWRDPEVQESLKAVTMLAFQVQAMEKFHQELDTPIPGVDDLEASRTAMLYHDIPKGVDFREWAAQQAIGPSNLSDDEGLVHYMNQPFFIANNVDAWLESLTRKSFGAIDDIGRMMSAESREYGAIKSKIARLENFYSYMFGDNVETGGEILEVLRQTGEFAMEDGTVVRKVGDEYVKFDNYSRRTLKVTMTEDDLRTVDLFKKMVAGYANGQKEIVTGVDRIFFRDSMANNDRSYYDREAVMTRYEDEAYADQQDPLEIALVRLTKQMPESVIGENGLNLYNRLADAAYDAMRSARDQMAAERKGADVEPADADGTARFNSLVLDSLRKAGLVVAHNAEGKRWQDKTPVWTKGAVCLSCDEIDSLFRNSEAYRKLTEEGGREAEWLSRDSMRDAFMEAYHEAVAFAKKHPWLVHGDGRYFHAFGTCLPFWRGSGVFMYNAVRANRDIAAEELEDLPEAEEKFLKSQESLNSTERIGNANAEDLQQTVDMFANVHGISMRGAALVRSIEAGEFEKGTKNADVFGVELTRDATVGDLSRAIYDRLVSIVWDRQMGGRTTGWGAVGNGLLKKGRPKGYVTVRSAEKILDAMERRTRQAGEMFGGRVGITDEEVFRKTGVLPANYQIGHKVHVAVDGLTNAMMSRATLVNMLMTPAFDGAPVYYADPSKFGADVSGIPDEIWGQVARWWSDYNGLGAHGYDPSKSGIQNAKDIFDALYRAGKTKDGKASRLNGKLYSIVSGPDGDIGSVERWLVRNDDQLGDESSMINALGGGEAMGYLKQFTQAGRVMGLGSGAVRQTLNRALSWSKSLSVSFSMFFPLATKWESPIGAVGAMATIASNSKMANRWVHENPELFADIQKIFGGKSWITKDFLGFQDVMRMMDSNDPFLAELYSWANALGITVSDRLVNPMEETKSLLESDIRRMKEALRDKFDAATAARFGRVADTLLLRGGDKAFSYALNATKLACVAQMAMKLRHEANARGKAFDPVRDLKRYGGYINAEIGGIDPLKYAWAHPMNRAIMNTLMFSWQWTRGAWEAGGGGVIEDMLFGGHSVTKEEREYFLGRWARMFGAVMIGVPAMLQVASMALAKALGGGDDDDDRWFTWQNEDKTKWTTFDLTPLLRAIGNCEPVVGYGTLADWKKAHPYLLSWLPAYTGTDAANQTNRQRRYYMHFGKQGWEFFRWFEAPGNQLFSKLSMPTQRLLEGFVGRNLSYLDRALPWDDMGPWERWLNPTTDGALFNLAQAFLPFTVSGLIRTGDAGLLPILGPVQMGASQTNIQDRLVKALTAWAHNDREGYKWGIARRGKAVAKLQPIVSDILEDAERNGFDKEEQLNKALGQVLTKEYGRLFKALPEDVYAAFDTEEINGAARAINRLSGKREQVLKSIKDRLKKQGRDWKSALTQEERDLYRALVRGSMANPFRTVDVPERKKPNETEIQRPSFDY